MRDTYSNEESYVEFLKMMMFQSIDNKKRSFREYDDYTNVRRISLNDKYKSFFSLLFK